jgi:MATE family multidrug resistance protein
MDEGIDSEKADGVAEGLVVTEVRKQLYLAGPLIVAWLLQNFVRMVSVMFVGHLGELALSSASIATSFANVTGFILMVNCSHDNSSHALGLLKHNMEIH